LLTWRTSGLASVRCALRANMVRTYAKHWQKHYM
jgi:hypothetical protein